jgi:OmpA-OmpF porin, OOP family
VKSRIVKMAVALAALAATPAWSQEAGIYIGAAVGQAEHKDGCEGANISCDEKDAAWKLFGGYQFNRYVAVEAGYADLGESRARGTVGAITVDAKFAVTAFELSAVGTVPVVVDRLSLMLRGGVYRAEAKLSGSGTVGAIVVPVSETDSNFDLTFGLGVRYDFTRNLGVRAEWQRYVDVGTDDVGKSDIDVLSIGVLWKF